MKIGEVGTLTGLTERTIRFYMQKELISPHTEWRGGREYTDFSEEDVSLLKAIATLRELSFSLEEIRTMEQTPDAIPSIVAARRDAAKEQLHLAENAHAVLLKLDGSGVRDISALAERARAAAAEKPHPIPPTRPREINESGMGDRCGHVPFEIKEKWNWGAFLMPVWWGLYNHVYQALLTCIPVFGFFYLFHLGGSGSELAWKHRYWESVEHFKKIQRRWALAAVLITASLLALNIGIYIASNREAARLEAEEAAMKEKLAASFEALPEWHAFLAGRKEWTKEHMRAAEEAGTAYAPNPSDLFYFEEAEYYRILYSHYFDFQAAGADISDAGEVVFPGENEALSYRVQVQFSDGSEYEILCEGDENGSLLTFSAVPDDAATEQNMTYIKAVKAAGELRAAYIAERTAEVIAHPLFVETFGEDHTFVNGPLPGFESYGDIYNGGELEIGGFYAEVMSGGKLYYVEIPAELDGTEGELSIREAESVPDMSGK
ncbi:MAG: MerR family transcriptional regulator [Clostridiales bacterium]|nr:MerR family transcriptional regulator [Clostridiales bacterium]